MSYDPKYGQAPGTPAPGQYPPPAYPPPPGQYPPPQYPPAQYPYPAVPPKKSGRLRNVLILVATLAVIAGLYGVNAYLKRNDISKAAVGDCASYDSSTSNPYKLADCGSADAKYVVLKIVTGGEQCKTIAGAERSTTTAAGEVCLGLNGVDPNTAINVAKQGDCIAVSGDDASRVPCDSPKATHKVLKVLSNVSKVTGVGPDPCENVPDATASYGWTWQTTVGGTAVSAPVYDVVLCLGDA